MEVIPNELFHDGAPYHIETSPLICRAYQWTSFCMIGNSILKVFGAIFGSYYFSRPLISYNFYRQIHWFLEDNFVLSDKSDSKFISIKISKVAIRQLSNGVTLRYCEQGCKTLLRSCTINEEKSVYDNIEWTRIWTAGDEVDFGVVTENNLQKVKVSPYSFIVNKSSIGLNFF